MQVSTLHYDVSPTKESGRKKMPVILISSLSKNNTSDKKLLRILKNSRNPQWNVLMVILCPIF